MSTLRPLCSTVVTRFLATTSLSDSRPVHVMQLCIPASRLCLLLLPSTALSGLPGPPRLFFPRALSPLTPASPATALVRYFVAGGRLLHFRQSGRSLLSVNEAESGSLTLRLACLARARPRQQDCSHSRSHALLVARTIDKVNSFQFTRTARLCLALPN
jgi:hypothetical protein